MMKIFATYSIYAVIGIMPAIYMDYSVNDINWWLFNLPYWVALAFKLMFD